MLSCRFFPLSDAMGGVDAEVDSSNPEHNGLANTIAELNAIWTNNQGDLTGLTRADFFAWSYVAGFYLAVPNNPPWVPLTFGRANFDGNIDEDIPPGSSNGSGEHSAVLDYFDDHFGFDERDVAVILGAHTLVSTLPDAFRSLISSLSDRLIGNSYSQPQGGAELQNSGYIDNWTQQENRFDNDYYQTLIDPGNPGWEQIQLNNGKFQWRWDCNGNGNGCRDLSKSVAVHLLSIASVLLAHTITFLFPCEVLNVDMNLFYDIESYLDEDTGEVSLPADLPNTAPNGLCDGTRVFADCFPQRDGEPTHTAVEQFESNNAQFVQEFSEVFGRLIERTKIASTL